MNAYSSYPAAFSSRLPLPRGRSAGLSMAASRRTSTTILPSVLLVSLAFICPAWALEPVNIGACLPMTGNSAADGLLVWDGIKMANKMEPHAMDCPVKLKLVDTRSDPAGAANAAFALIERDRVVAVIGELVWSKTFARSVHVERRGIPMVTPTAASSEVSRGENCVFRTCPLCVDQARAAAVLAVNHLNARSAALICDLSQEHSIELVECFGRKFVQAGSRIVAQTRIKRGDRDFTGQINRIRSAKPDVVYAPIDSVECALIARQAREAGLGVPLIAGDMVQGPELVELGGTAVEGLLFTSYFQEDMHYTERGEQFRNAYERDRGTKPQARQMMGAEAYFMILDAIRRAGSSDPARIHDALALAKSGKNYASEGLIRNSNPQRTTVCINEVRNGKFIAISGAGACSLSRNSEMPLHVIPTSTAPRN